MKRSEFVKCCMAGVCGCAVSSLLPAQAAVNPETDELKWKMNFVHQRFAKLVQILRDNLDEQTRNKVFENLGRECARQFSGLTEKHRGDIRGFLAAIQQQWAAATEYDAKTGAIRVIDKSSTCTCALVNQSMTPGDFCHCTIGWQKHAYSTVLGKPVEVEVEESILRGGKHCIFRIRPAN